MRIVLRILVILVIVVALVVTGLAGFVIYSTRRPLPQVAGTLALPGLDGEVKVYRDSFGIPHIYATTTHDLFYAQGVIQAQDRWWQMEMNRHIGLGRVSELSGKNASALANDIFIRTVGWNRAAQADLDALSPDTLSILNSYSEGINAYLGSRSSSDLAVDYTVLGIRGVNIPIEKWEPLHTLAWAKVMAWSLGGNLDQELAVIDLAKKLGSERAPDIFKYIFPPYPEGFPTIVTQDELPTAPEPVTTRNLPTTVNATNVETRLIGTPPDVGIKVGLGSNNWVVSGSKTQSGKPLLSNDPHLANQMPSIWYQNGLHCVEVSPQCPFDVVGYSFPGTPGVVIGHNARIAWGVTNGTIDTQDTYIIEVDPKDDTKYIVDGKTLDMDVVTETIRFGDGTPSKDIRVRVTRFGPIITDSEYYEKSKIDGSKPLALKWAAISETGDLMGSVLRINQASDWNSFRAALTKWAWPAQNFVYADVEGNIGYQFPGLHPVRAPGHDGQQPIDGSTAKYDWQGFIPFEYLPRVFNPKSGYIATANNAIVPDSYFTWLASQLSTRFVADAGYSLNRAFFAAYRQKRIVDLLQKQDKHSIDTMRAIQADAFNEFASQILPEVLKLDFGADIPDEVIDWMKSWDYVESMESGKAALFGAFWAALTRNLWADELGYPLDGDNVAWGITLLMGEPTNQYWDNAQTTDRKESRDDILRASLVDGYHDLVKRLGKDYKTWQWGALHTTKFVSRLLGQSGIGIIENFVNAGPVATNGSSFTVNRAAWDTESPYTVGSISSMRMIIDFSDMNKSLWINATGQSGHPTSDNYRDQIELWRKSQYNPMRWNREEIQSTAQHVLTLVRK